MLLQKCGKNIRGAADKVMGCGLAARTVRLRAPLGRSLSVDRRKRFVVQWN